MEIAVWQIINDEVNITQVKKKYFLQRMMMTALLAKKFTNDEQTIQVFYSFLNHNYPKFMESYKIWKRITKMSDEVLTFEKIS